MTGDITKIEVDAIVNAANSGLRGGGGVDGAIHAAGGPSIHAECQQWVREHGPLPTGQAMVTGGGELAALHVIHTVGPKYASHVPEESKTLLTDCYQNSLRLAAKTNCRSIAFPNISTGIYGYPKKEAASTAVTAVRNWVSDNDALDRILFVCFDETNYRIYSELLDS